VNTEKQSDFFGEYQMTNIDQFTKTKLRRKLAAKMGAGVTLGILIGTAIGTVTMNNTGLGLAIGIIVGGIGGIIYRWKTRRQLQYKKCASIADCSYSYKHEENIPISNTDPDP
jgi:uncharacterized membrane protein